MKRETQPWRRTGPSDPVPFPEQSTTTCFPLSAASSLSPIPNGRVSAAPRVLFTASRALRQQHHQDWPCSGARAHNQHRREKTYRVEPGRFTRGGTMLYDDMLPGKHCAIRQGSPPGRAEARPCKQAPKARLLGLRHPQRPKPSIQSIVENSDRGAPFRLLFHQEETTSRANWEERGIATTDLVRPHSPSSAPKSLKKSPPRFTLHPS